jgi:hypothetical protein
LVLVKKTNKSNKKKPKNKKNAQQQPPLDIFFQLSICNEQ